MAQAEEVESSHGDHSRPSSLFYLQLLFAFMSAVDLARCEECCHAWRDEMTAGGWDAACERDWAPKNFVPAHVRHMHPRKAAYIAALRDVARVRITRDELCQQTWSFRFKAVAGENWVARDSWWSGGPAQRMVWLPDQICYTVPSFENVTWKFDGDNDPNATSGESIRLTVDGREAPTYIISRHRDKWGWVLQNCWVIMTTWEMPLRSEGVVDPYVNEDAVTVNDQFAQVVAFNTGVLPMAFP
jgi:hypothetical protein